MSRELKQLLFNENFLQHFEQHCVDGKIEHYKKMGLTNVPTLIVPSIQKPLIAKEAFEWLSNMKFMTQQRQIEMNRQIIQQSATKFNQSGNDNVLGFFKPEMGGFSDNYAFTSADVAQHQSFFGYKDEDNNAIFTSPESTKKITNSEFTKQKQVLEKDRGKQSAELKKFQEKQQLQDVVRSEIRKIMEK